MAGLSPQVPYDRREELLIKGGLDPKKDLLNLTLRYNVSNPISTPCQHNISSPLRSLCS